jgi:hypothetical protein
MRIATLLLVLLLIGGAGCSQRASDGSGTTSQAPGTSSGVSSTVTSTGSPPGPELPGNRTIVDFFGTSCDGFVMILDGPNALYPGRPVADWGQNPNSPDNEMQHQVLRCERISWGPFERGPVYVIQEWQGNFDLPDSCRGSNNGNRALESIWFSDPDIARFAHDAYGMNAYSGTFSSDVESIGTSLKWTWTWANGTNAASRVTVYDPALGFNETIPYLYRVYWGNGVGVSYMDYSFKFVHGQLGEIGAEGTLPAPMM